jgi:hypothetical protein
MKSLSIAMLACSLVWLANVLSPVHGQAPAGAATRSAAPALATQGRGDAKTSYLTADGRRDARLTTLETSMDEIRTRLSRLEMQVNGLGGSGRPAVQLTPEDRYPPRNAGKGDNLQEIQNAIQNIWATIDLIKTDIRRVNGK